MTFLIFLGCVVGYLVIGAVYARTQAVAIDSRIEYDYRRDEETRKAVGIRVSGWPVMIFVDFVRGPAYAWTTLPISARLKKIKALDRDADYWRSRMHTGSELERDMAETLVRSLHDQAAELRRALGRRYY